MFPLAFRFLEYKKTSNNVGVNKINQFNDRRKEQKSNISNDVLQGYRTIEELIKQNKHRFEMQASA